MQIGNTIKKIRIAKKPYKALLLHAWPCATAYTQSWHDWEIVKVHLRKTDSIFIEYI